MLPICVLLAAAAAQAHVAGRFIDVFGESEAAEKAAKEADAAARRFQELFATTPLRGAIVLTRDGHPVKDAKKDMAYTKNGAKWVWRWEQGKGQEPDETMTHELGHLWLIFWKDGTGLTVPQYGSSLPDWLDEGIANLLEGPRAHEAYRSGTRQRVEAGTHMPLTELFTCLHPGSREKSDRPKAKDRWLFYAQTYSITAFLAESCGADAFRHVVYTLKDGRKIEDALGHKGLPATLADLEKAWKAWVLAPPK